MNTATKFLGYPWRLGMRLIDRFCNIFGYCFRAWGVGYLNHTPEYKYNSEVNENKIRVLTENLDQESIEIINFYAQWFIKNKRFIKIGSINLDKNFYKLTSEELQAISKKYKIPSKDNLNMKNIPMILDEVFKFKCGLNFADKTIVEKLKNKSAITAGALWGDSPLVLSEFCETVYGFEPNSNSFKVFQKTIVENNKVKQIIPINYGLSDSTMEMQFDTTSISTGSHLIKQSSEPSNKKNIEIVKVITIDDFIKENNVINLGFIHLDIEGFEYSAIIGAEQTIKKFKPTMSISIYHTTKDFFEIKPLIESWNLGYKFKIRKLSRSVLETMLICEPPQ